MMAALTKAKKFDLIRVVTYHAGPDTSAGEDDGLARIAATRDAIRRTLSLPELVSRDLTKRAWLTRFVEIDLDQLIQRVPWEDDAYWQALREAATDVVAHVDTDLWSQLHNECAVRCWLVAEDHRDELETYLSERRFEKADQRTEPQQGVIYGLLPFHDSNELHPPRQLYALSDRQTALRTSIRGKRWTAEGTLEIDAWAYVPYLDLTDVEPVITAHLVETTTGERHNIAVELRRDPMATRVAGQKYQNHDHAAFTVRIDAADLCARVSPETEDQTGTLSRWRVDVGFSAHGVRRGGVLGARDLKSSAGYLNGLAFGDLKAVPTGRRERAHPGDPPSRGHLAGPHLPRSRDRRIHRLAVASLRHPPGIHLHGRLSGHCVAVRRHAVTLRVETAGGRVG